jgi:hypothetical protein
MVTLSVALSTDSSTLKSSSLKVAKSATVQSVAFSFVKPCVFLEEDLLIYGL